MDPFPGIEVGAEVELNEGVSAVEDVAAIRLENKQDLPLWQHLHHFDDSSSDESLGYYHETLSPDGVKNQETTNTVIDLKSLVKVENHPDTNVSAFSSTGDPQPALLYVNEVPSDDPVVIWNNSFNKGLQDQLYQPAPCFEETGISCVEVIPSIDSGQIPPSYSTEVYAKNISSYEEDLGETFGKYSYFNAKTQFTGSVKPWGKSHTCQQCGRQFGRLYNLENHKCIKMCLGTPQQHIVNIETMNRLEKMCAEAQKELQNLQGHFKKEQGDAMASGLEESNSSDIQVWSQEGLSDTARCNNCGLQFGSGFNLDVHVCKEDSSQNLTSPENTVTVDLTHLTNQKEVFAGQAECIVSQLGPVEGERTHLNQNTFSQNSGSYLVESTKGSTEATTFYKCLECGKMFDKRCSITNHMRWHAKERRLISSVGNAVVGASVEVQEPDGNVVVEASPEVQEPVGNRKAHVGPTKPTQTFSCEYCGRIFNKHCSYATHVSWHLKYQERKATSEIQEANSKVEQVPLPSMRKQKRHRGCASPIKMCTCHSCGRDFNKIRDFVSHTCGTIEERQDQQGLMEAQVFLVADEEYSEESKTKDIVDQNNMASDGDSSKEGPGSCPNDGNSQGYCNLVGQLSLDEQQKAEEAGCDLLTAPTELQSQPPQVLESIFELIVGTEEVHEILLSKRGHVLLNGEDCGNSEVKQKDIQVKVEKRPRPAFKRRLLNRPNPPHRCRDCGIRFHQFWRLKRHRFKEIGNRRAMRKHQCDCGKTPIGSLHFLLHQLQHLRDTPFICAVCGKELRGYRQLQAHSWVHRLASHFQCMCGARFTQLPRYLWHSLLNNAKAKPKAPLRPASGLQAS